MAIYSVAAPAAIRCSVLRQHRSMIRSKSCPTKDFLAVFRPGDIVKFRSVSREEYDRDVKAVAAGTFNLPFAR